MRVPHSIPSHAFEAYRCSEETLLLPSEQNRTLRAENEEWDKYIPEPLRCQALRVIAKHWRDKPVLDSELPTLDDLDLLLETLPLDLPFAMAVKAIPHEHYWQRTAEARWKFNDPTSHGDSWLRLYCERHLSEYLEGLEPAYFESERAKCESLLELVREHVRTLELRQLLPHRSKPRPIPPVGEDDEEEEEEQKQRNEGDKVGSKQFDEPVHVIPLDLIFEGLPYLRNICINVGVVHSSDLVEWQDFRFSVEDAVKLGRGLRNLEHLEKFSLTRSYLDQPRLAAILQGLAVNDNVDEIDLSHCKLGDAGGLAVGGFLARRQPRCLRLVNCGIGSEGLAGIVLGILDNDKVAAADSAVGKLDLRLNPLGDEGSVHLAALLLRFAFLEYLNVSGCGLGPDGGMGIAEVLASGRTKFSRLELDCSNNCLGTIVGEAFEIVTKACIAITELDARMCGFRKESEYSISESVNRNRKAYQAGKEKVPSRDNISSRSRRRNSSLKVADTQPSVRLSLAPPPEFAIFQRPHECVPPVPKGDGGEGGGSSEQDVKSAGAGGGGGSKNESSIEAEVEEEEEDVSQIG